MRLCSKYLFYIIFLYSMTSHANDVIQQTQGDCSPVVNGVNGNPTINCFFDKNKKEWSFDFSVFVSSEYRDGDDFNNPYKEFKKNNYLLTEENNTISVFPNLEFLTNCGSLYHFGNPIFDIKVVNNNKQSIVVSKVIFHIDESIPDNSRFICIGDSTNDSIYFETMYGVMSNVEFRYNITHSKEHINFNNTYDYLKALTNVNEIKYSGMGRKVSFRESLINAGIPMDRITEQDRKLYNKFMECNVYNEKMKKLRSCDKKTTEKFKNMLDKINLGRYTPKMYPYSVESDRLEPAIGRFEEYFEDFFVEQRYLSKKQNEDENIRYYEFKKRITRHNTAEVIIYGQMSYDRYDYLSKKTQKQTFNFTKSLPILLFIDPYGDGIDISARYNAVLNSLGKKYQVIVPVSQQLKDGEADRFTIGLSVDKTSYHRFTIELVTTSGLKLRSKPIELGILWPDILNEKSRHPFISNETPLQTR